jgi:hypothetical protein
MRGDRGARSLALVIALTLAACDSAPEEIPWEVRAADPSLSERIAVIETSVHRGGCDGVLVYRASIGRGRRGPPPMLGRGLHGFAAEARDAACRPIARACIEHDLPLARGARVELVLVPTSSGAPECAPSECRDGTCEGGDASTAIDDDAGEGPVDAGAPPSDDDAGEAAADAGAPPVDPVDAGGEDPVLDAGPPPERDAGPPPETDAGPPPSTCDGTEWSGRCYHFATTARTFDEAESGCVSWGGHLVSIGGPSEQTFVRTLTGASPYWIGLTDAVTEGEYAWIDGSSASYREWASSFPRAMRADDDCVSDQPDRGGWIDRRCRETNASVCER